MRELRELVRYRAKLVALRTAPGGQERWGLAGTTYLNGLERDDGYHTKVALRDWSDPKVTMLERGSRSTPGT